MLKTKNYIFTEIATPKTKIFLKNSFLYVETRKRGWNYELMHDT